MCEQGVSPKINSILPSTCNPEVRRDLCQNLQHLLSFEGAVFAVDVENVVASAELSFRVALMFFGKGNLVTGVKLKWQVT